MISLKSLTLAAAAIAALAFPPTALSGIYKCEDPSGKITFSGQGCGNSGSTEAVRVEPVDTEDNSRLRPVRKSAGDASNLCEEAMTPYKGAQNGQPTASQLAVAAACAGVKSESVNPTISDEYKKKPQTKLQPSQQPSMITNCDPGGCWDNQGQRYNGTGGTPYFRQDGKVCQSVAGRMQCH